MAPPMPSDLFQRENRYIYTSISSTETVYLDAFRDIQSIKFFNSYSNIIDRDWCLPCLLQIPSDHLWQKKDERR